MRRPRAFQNFITLLACTFFALASQLAIAHGDVHERIAAVNERIAQDTNNATLYIQRGELHREHQDWPAATADYDRAAQLDLKLSRVDFYRARLFADTGDFAKARAALDTHLQQNPADAEALIARARTLTRLGETNLAAADYSRGTGMMSEPQPDFFAEQAELLAKSGDVSGAIAILDSGIAKLGPLVTLQTRAIELELARTNHTAAVARLDTIIARANRKEAWLARRGEILLSAGRKNEACAAFESSRAAVKSLPARLQQSEAMLALQSRVNAVLDAITNSPEK